MPKFEGKISKAQISVVLIGKQLPQIMEVGIRVFHCLRSGVDLLLEFFFLFFGFSQLEQSVLYI